MPEITSAPIDRKPDTDKRSWHRKASRPVSGWLVALLIVAVANPWIPQSRWLLVHMVTLGVATTSIMVWGQYFTEAILHNNLTDTDRSRQVLRIRLLTVGIVITCIGMVVTWPWMTVTGAAVIGSMLTWYAFALGRQVRHALPGRFDSTVWFYCAAACLLPLGATLGTIMAFSPTEPWRTRLLVRSTVGHKVMRVPTTVRPTKPSRLSAWWATNRRVRHGSVGEKAMIVPRVAPSGSRHAAAQ